MQRARWIRFFKFAAALVVTPVLPGCEDLSNFNKVMQENLAMGKGIVTTVGFEKSAQQLPWVNDLKRSVGHIFFENSITIQFDGRPVTVVKSNSLGSAVLLDNDGTLLLTSHQADSWEAALAYATSGSFNANVALKISFPIGGNKPYDVHFNVSDIRHDIAFATISPTHFEKAKVDGVRPVQLGETDWVTPGQSLVIAGYPVHLNPNPFFASGLKLHADIGVAASFEDSSLARGSEILNISRYYCRSTALIMSVNGESGGGMFLNGVYIGTNSSGTSYKAEFVPVAASLEVYRHVFPDRAKRLGIIEPIAPTDIKYESCGYRPEALRSFYPIALAK